MVLERPGRVISTRLTETSGQPIWEDIRAAYVEKEEIARVPLGLPIIYS